MSILDANVKTSFCKKQFFQTLPEQVDALCAFLETQYKKDVSILDVGSGEGAISTLSKSNKFEEFVDTRKYRRDKNNRRAIIKTGQRKAPSLFTENQ